MRKPALGRSGASFSKMETVEGCSPFLSQVPPDKQAPERNLGHRLLAEPGVILIDGGKP